MWKKRVFLNLWFRRVTMSLKGEKHQCICVIDQIDRNLQLLLPGVTKEWLREVGNIFFTVKGNRVVRFRWCSHNSCVILQKTISLHICIKLNLCIFMYILCNYIRYAWYIVTLKRQELKANFFDQGSNTWYRKCSQCAWRQGSQAKHCHKPCGVSSCLIHKSTV